MAHVLHRRIEQARGYDVREVAPPEPDTEPEVQPGGERRRRWAEALDRDIGAGRAWLIGLSWLVVVPAVWLLRPAPADPEATVPAAVGVVLAMWQLVVLAGLVGLVSRKRWGIAASLAAGTVLLADTVACPATGHHAFAGWWFAQLALVGLLFGISARAFSRT